MRLFKRGRVWYCNVYEGGVRVQRSTRCCDHKAAQARARLLELAGADPDHARTVAATLSDALRLLVENRRELATAGRRSADTVRFYERKAGTLARILESAGPLPLTSLRAHHVDAYISQRRAERVKDHTIAKELGALRAALKLARRAAIWKGDPAEVCPIGFAPEYKPRTRSLSRAELGLLLGELRADHAARVAFIVATSACWRETELALRKDPGDDQVLVRGTKRARRFRVVPIVTPEQRSLIAYALEHAKGDGEALFAPWANVRHDLERACRRAGIPRCSPNDLRRTTGTWLRAAGAAPDLIAPMMGHVDSRMVERVYGRLPTDALAGRLALATGSVEVLVARLVLARFAALLELVFGCSAGASTGLAFGAPAAFGALADPMISRVSVPRDGIEPPTRGFSIVGVAWPTPREDTPKRPGQFGAAAPVHHRDRLVG